MASKVVINRLIDFEKLAKTRVESCMKLATAHELGAEDWPAFGVRNLEMAEQYLADAIVFDDLRADLRRWLKLAEDGKTDRQLRGQGCIVGDLARLF